MKTSAELTTACRPAANRNARSEDVKNTIRGLSPCGNSFAFHANLDKPAGNKFPRGRIWGNHGHHWFHMDWLSKKACTAAAQKKVGVSISKAQVRRIFALILPQTIAGNADIKNLSRISS